MKKLLIALDVDGVLADFSSGALRIVEEVTGKRFVPADITAWDFTASLGLSADETVAVMQTIGAKRGFAASLSPYRHARQGVRRLRALGDIFCVTSPWESNAWWRAERESWLALHFGIDVVHHASDKTGYEADVFVDDKASNVRDWLAAWPGRTAVFWRTPHNSAEPVPWGAHSTSSWDALYDLALETARTPHTTPTPTLEACP